MGRLSLVIADCDMDYLSKFEKFLMINYPQRFDIFSFSSPGKLWDFMGSSNKKDILLINSKMYKNELCLKNVEAIMLLSGDSAEPAPEGLETIYKYQHAERLVTDILRFYAARSMNAGLMPGQGNTRIVCIYSPAGGVGKSSIAAGCSILSARKGLKTFYLNMEDVPTTSLFFSGESIQNFSNVIYHLKGKGNNLGLKLEGAKCCDPRTGVHFFAHPDSILEMSELSDHDVVRLVSEFKAGITYDIVFIDMPCGLNQRNAAILGCADLILMVLVPGDIAAVKMNELKAGLELLEHKYGAELAGRTITVLNRSNKKAGTIGNTGFANGRAVIEIGECISQGIDGHAAGLIENVAFLSGLNKLLEHVLPRDAAASPVFGGR